MLLRYSLKASLVICLAIVMNYAVAWLCVIWSPLTASAMPALSEDYMPPPRWHGGPENELGYWQAYWGKGYVEYQKMEVLPIGPGPASEWGSRDEMVYTRDAGWPYSAFRSQLAVYHLGEGENFRFLTGWELPLSEIIRRGVNTNDLPQFVGAKQSRRLPFVFIWPGFLLNMLFYGLIACMMLHAHRLVSFIVNQVGKGQAFETRAAI